MTRKQANRIAQGDIISGSRANAIATLTVARAGFHAEMMLSSHAYLTTPDLGYCPVWSVGDCRRPARKGFQVANMRWGHGWLVVAASVCVCVGVRAAALADAAGRYSILRDGGKDTGCMLTLDKRVKAPGGEKASLAPGCRDQGIVIFDPAGWKIVNSRLVLTARKGHKTYLDAQPDGSWKKDPKEGKNLTLKKL
jgi:Protease inhibitor Inh